MITCSEQGLVWRKHLGRVRISEFAQSPGTWLPAHRHDRLSAFVVLRGSYTELTSRSLTRCGDETIVLKVDGCPHSDVAGRRGFRGLLVEAPCMIAGDSAINASVKITDASIRSRTLRLRRLALRGQTEDAAAQAEELIASISDAASRIIDCPSWFDEVETMLYADLDTDICLDDLARRAKVSPSSLQRAFRRHRGMNVCEFIANVRLRAALHLLEQSDGPIAAIAAETGFYDQSHLHRKFCDAFGSTPRQYRTAAKGAAGSLHG